MPYLPDAVTRKEKYYQYLATGTGVVPDPVTREEQYLYYLCKNGTAGSGITPEQIQQAVDNYLDENPATFGKLSVEDHVLNLVPGGGSDEDT